MNNYLENKKTSFFLYFNFLKNVEIYEKNKNAYKILYIIENYRNSEIPKGWDKTVKENFASLTAS